jgi:hypothetical protein
VQLGIDYYRPADGDGSDWGTLYGRDDDGPWELLFANPEEMTVLLDRVIGELTRVATEAREELAEEAGAGTAVWLKAIGAVSDQITENWWHDERRQGGIDFPYKPRSIKNGDLLVLYGSGTGKVVGVERVVGDWYEGNRHPRWPYRVNTELLAYRPLSEGVELVSLNHERELTKSIRQKSHVRLTEAEAAEALGAFDICTR